MADETHIMMQGQPSQPYQVVIVFEHAMDEFQITQNIFMTKDNPPRAGG
jgi:hypothetical protein